MAGSAFLSVQPGALVSFKGRRFKVTHVLDVNRVLAQDVETRKIEQLRVDLLHAAEEQDEAIVAVGRDLNDFPQEEWGEAQRRFALIRSLVEAPYRTRQMAEEVAANAGVHVATIYQWLRAYNDSGHLVSLIPDKPGPQKGSRRLTPELEAIVEAAINDLYLTGQRQKPQKVVDEVMARCKTACIEPPHPNTIRNRIRMIPAAQALRRRGMRDKARDQFEPIRGHFPNGNFPLEVVQIDHTEADIILVEEQTRLPMGRPWLTLAIDCFSRMIVGCYVSMDPPSSEAVGMCLSMAMLPKNEYLAELEVPGDWPVWGHIRAVHSDNGKEFRSAMLQRACEDYSIDLQYRPGKLPHFGGHIERMMGTSASDIHTLPGTTFSSPKPRSGYDSEKKAALTLREFEQRLVDFIVNVYHQRKHSELEMPPRRKWELGILGDASQPGIGIPDVPGDPARLRLDFLPYVRRTVQTYGILIDDIYYYHEVLNRWIGATDPDDTKGKRKRKFIVRRRRRDISVVYFFDPEANQYYTIPYRDVSHPSISLWELRAAQKRLKEEGRASIDEARIFEAVERMRSRVDQAVTKTAAARRQHHRIKATKKLANSRQAVITDVPKAAEPAADVRPDLDDIFARPITPFERRKVKP